MGIGKVAELQRLAQWLTHGVSLSPNTPRPLTCHTVHLFLSKMFGSVHYFNCLPTSLDTRDPVECVSGSNISHLQ